MNKTLKMISLVAASFAVGAVANAHNHALVDTLVKKGYLTTEEAKEVSKSGNMASPSSATKTSSITFGGQLQAQYDYLSTSASDVPNTDIPGTQADTTKRSAIPSIRRANVMVHADLVDQWSADLAFGATTSDPNDLNQAAGTAGVSNIQLDTALINWSMMEEFNLSLGYDTTPFGLENTSSSTTQKTLESSAAARLFDQGLGIGNTNIGVFAKGTFMDGFYYNAALSRLSGYADNGSFKDPFSNTPAMYARLGYMHTMNDWHFDLGLDGAYLRGKSKKNSEGKDAITYAGGIYLKANYRDFSLATNFMGATIKDAKATSNDTAKPWGLMVMPSYKFMDGKYEVVAMYSYANTGKAKLSDQGGGVGMSTIQRGVNLTNKNTVYGDYGLNSSTTIPAEALFNNFHQFYVGGNWYIMGDDVKLTVGYTFTQAKDASEFTDLTGPTTPATGYSKNSKFKVHSVGARLQLLF